MGLTVISPEHVANLLNNWYMQMRSQSLEKSEEIKIEVESLLDRMEENQTVLLYYALLEFRYKLFLQQFDESGQLLKKIDLEQDGMGGILSFYYHFFNGMYEYELRQYDKALESYRIAEKELDRVPDPIEKAEFHYKVASVFYHIRQNFISINHANKALEIFENDPHYTKRTAHTQLILGLNNVAFHQYSEAENKFRLSLQYAIEKSDRLLENQIYHNLGLLFSEKGDSEVALYWFEKAIAEDGMSHKTMYLIAREAFRCDRMETALEWVRQGVTRCKQKGDKEYLCRFNILRVTHITADFESFEAILKEGISYFYDKGVWSYVEDYALTLAEFYRHHEVYREACDYYHIADEAKRNIKERGIL